MIKVLNIPELILLPGGKFMMGGTDDEESPRHEVTIGYDFAISRSPVTVGEYLACVEDGGCPPPEWLEPGSRHHIDTGSSDYYGASCANTRHPIVGVSWFDAQAYCHWLSAQTGQTYRLPSEAEWEYTCRAGSEGDYCFGSEVDCLVEYAWYNKNAGDKTHPVGELKPNAWGLHDMHGNVWEWCQDEWHGNYQGAPVDGSAWQEAESTGSRVLRGGSWCNLPDLLAAAFRNSHVPALRDNDIGFRVVCAVPSRT
jgi:formylglycine-generating enzyme required for sulfatase activity